MRGECHGDAAPLPLPPQRTLGIAPPEEALFYIIMSPVGPYYKGGFKPIKLIAEATYSRAAKGGTGQFKLGRFVLDRVRSARVRPGCFLACVPAAFDLVPPPPPRRFPMRLLVQLQSISANSGAQQS